MSRYFVPYEGDRPAAVEVKGHRLLIVASSPDALVQDDYLIVGNEIREVSVPKDQEHMLANLAASVRGGVVVAPPGMTMTSMLLSLEAQLPWVH